MVLFLILDIPHHGCNVRLAYPEPAYPCCHANLPISPDIHPEEFVLIVLIASAIMRVGGNCSNR